ncbi:hypothetical protein TCON_1048 [Astathelohania contejeani]|uniref:Uncharacterized protein n=1 Tax=Astathelohania contejeani TaxID=164912 RepID=A0ABQ7I021_9MICR|nr:hypothetical protein TCON_1048 [Thelohania contejeani]
MNAIGSETMSFISVYKSNLKKELDRNPKFLKKLEHITKSYIEPVYKPILFLKSKSKIVIAPLKIADSIMKTSLLGLHNRINRNIPYVNFNFPQNINSKHWFIPQYYGGIPSDKLLHDLMKGRNISRDNSVVLPIKHNMSLFSRLRFFLYKLKLFFNKYQKTEEIIFELENINLPIIFKNLNNHDRLRNMCRDDAYVSFQFFIKDILDSSKLIDLRNVESKVIRMNKNMNLPQSIETTFITQFLNKNNEYMNFGNIIKFEFLNSYKNWVAVEFQWNKL